MKKNKIVVKLFAITACILLAFLAIQFLFQYFYMEKFYVYNKKKMVANELLSLKQKIENNSIKESEINQALTLFSEENNAFAGISNIYGIPQYGFNGKNNISTVEIKSNKNQLYKIYIDGFLNKAGFIEKLEESKNIEIKGNILESNKSEIYPDTIIIDDETFSIPKITVFLLEDKTSFDIKIMSSDTNIDKEKNLTVIKNNPMEEISIEGVITDIMLPSKESYGIEYRKDKLLHELKLFLDKKENLNIIFSKEKMIEYSKLDTFTGIENLVFIQPLYVKNKVPYIMFAVSSLQPIEETSEIMKSYFLFILLIAMVLAIIAAYFYSKGITKPLLHINTAAENIAKLDFSHECIVYTKDEIGELAKNINIMSDNLQKTINDLNKANEKLKEDIELKEKVENMRKQFIADASHELKTPLTVMNGICEGLLDGIYDRKDSKYFKQLSNEIQDMRHLVYSLLEISKIDAGELPLNKEVFQLSDVILKIHDKLKILIENKRIQVDLDLSDCFVLGDEKKLERVINNFYCNAVKYTPENGKINISIREEENRCIFIMENSPAKISEDDLSKIWEPFYRIEKSRNKSLGGSGLGLYIVKQILDNHNSMYGIESTNNSVEVYFDLPLLKEEY